MSKILRIHKPPGTRIRLFRVDAPRPVAPVRAADHRAAPEGVSGRAAEGEPHAPVETIPVDLDDLGTRLRDAFEQGKAEGRAEAGEEMDRRLAAVRAETDDRIGALMGGIAHQVRAFTAALEHDAYAFALAVAARIVKREIQLDDEVAIRQVRDALRRVVGVDSITVRVHPDDEELIRSHRTALLAVSDTIREVVIEPDETIERGGCILVSASGNVDARIATQLRQVEHALRTEERTAGERLS